MRCETIKSQDDDEANRDNEKDDEFDERNNKVWIVLLLMFICKWCIMIFHPNFQEIQDVSIILEQGVANDQIHIPVRPLEEVMSLTTLLICSYTYTWFIRLSYWVMIELNKMCCQLQINLHDHAIMNVSGVSEQNDNARKVIMV